MSRWWTTPPFHLKFALTHAPFKPHNFDQYLPIAPQLRAGEKVQLAQIGSRLRAFQWAINEPCMIPLSPPNGGTKRYFAVFARKFNFCRKTSATKFLCVKNSSSKVVATSFPYLMVHRRMAGDVPNYLKFALKMTYPLGKRRFRQISLNSASAARASEKSSIITKGCKRVTHLAAHESVWRQSKTGLIGVLN